MSGATKKGPCRIPTFGSRIPHIQAPTSGNAAAAAAGGAPRDVTAKHVGQRVRVGDKEGVLRFVGEVQFAKGAWCGVELDYPVGKNDGCVNGVRYFECASRCGLMAPLAKAEIVVKSRNNPTSDGSCESLSDRCSGPYSMLFIDPKNDLLLNRAGSQEVLSRKRETRSTRPLKTTLPVGGTFDLQKNLHDRVVVCKAAAKNKTEDNRKKFAEANKNRANGTFDVQDSSVDPSKRTANGTFDIPDTNIDPSGRRANGTFDIPDTNIDPSTKRRNGTFDIPDPFVVASKKRSNDTFELPERVTESSNKRSNDHDATTTNPNEERGEAGVNLNLTFLPLKDPSENIPSVEVKRRKTSNPKANETVVKPSSLPQLLSDPLATPLELKKFTFSTPLHSEFKEPFVIKPRISNIHVSDENSKRDSLEFDESLGILTPDQMLNSVQFSCAQSRSSSLEYDVNLQDCFKSGSKSELTSPRVENVNLEEELAPNVGPKMEDKPPCKAEAIGIPNVTLRFKTPNMDIPALEEVKEDVLLSPNLTDYSLGIIDDQILSNRTDTTMNMELPLDPVGRTLLTRLEQTPSPEELPLDPMPTVESEPKTEPSKSKTSNSFVTSITSITSLDTGYQGDGEMSRPASRGADNSPLTRRPLPRPQVRRHEPMTDSDFFTESDADNHEENHLRGDRRAQVIDGTLYGVDPQAAADIYVNNRENMDSSGIFTDIESNIRNDEATEAPDVSPSDTSTKTISENSQDNIKEILDKTLENKDVEKLKDNPKKRNAPSPGILSPSSLSSPRHGKEENAAKKYKMPKRDVVSKVKAMLEPANRVQTEKKPSKKPVGRWDAVMDKISKGDQNKTNLKEVKSKVFSEVNVTTSVGQRLSDPRKQGNRIVGNQKSPNNKICTTPVKRPGSAQSLPSSEKRRIRNRPNSGSPPKGVGGSNIESSIHSSLSDLSAATLPPSNKTPGSAKKRADVVQVTQVLTANKLSPRNQQRHTAAENKKNATLHASSEPKGRTLFSPKEKKQATIKECGRGTVKGGRTSPSVRPPAQTRVTVKQPPVAEALAVLVQHLVFNVEAYQVPNLRREVEKYRSAAEEIRLSCQKLEETLQQEKIQHARAIEEERAKCQQGVAELIAKHKNQIAELTDEYSDLERRLRSDSVDAERKLRDLHDVQLATLKEEFDKLRRTHEESLDILREENESIRELIDEKTVQIERLLEQNDKMKKYYEKREEELKEYGSNLAKELETIEERYKGRYEDLVAENGRLKEENERLLSYGDDKRIAAREVESLRAVLELKQNALAELRKELQEETHKAEMLKGAEEKARVLQARCEDLNLQLERKTEYEKLLIQENQKLQESFKEETHQKRRLSQHNEELQWKLKQNKEVISKVLEQAEESAFNRSLLSSSFNERHNHSAVSRPSLERTLSFRERANSNRSNVSLEESIRSRKSKASQGSDLEDLSPPTSPKVKGVVEKSDSVSYVLDMDESPEVVANRIVRRSFRNSTPPKNTPTKSNSKPLRSRNPLSQSASSSAIISSNRNDYDRPRSAASRNGDYENDNVFPWSSSPKYRWDDSQHHDHRSYESSNSSVKLEGEPLDLDEEDDDVDDIELPALPSELDRRNGRQAVLPSPRRLAGEAAVSESNSEDESTSSSQL